MSMYKNIHFEIIHFDRRIQKDRNKTTVLSGSNVEFLEGIFSKS